MNIKKNEQYVVDIIDNGYDGEGIAKIEGITVFVPETIKGEMVKILILKVTSSHAFAKKLEIINPSKNRVDSECMTYAKCGGCSLRHINYEETLNIKKDIVKNCLRKSMNRDYNVNDTIGMKNSLYYRNKLQYPVGLDRNSNLTMGVYGKRSHEIIETKKCYIQNLLCQDIAKDIYEFLIKNNISAYDETNLKGTVRHIVVKIGLHTNEIMVIIVINEELKKQNELIEYLTSKYKEIKTIVKNYNMQNTNVILGEKTEVIYGDGYIYDTLGDYKFKISPKSFYQVNPAQTEVLYNMAIKFAKLTGKENVFDLYCGIGTIGIFASKYVKKVYGIEIVESAIRDAKENAKINNIENADFFCGKVEEVFPKIIEDENINPEIVFIDPPRKGMDIKIIDTLLKIKPHKIIYISCNPATMARDVKLLSENYELREIQPIDCFPFTSHVEVCALLEYLI